MTSTILELRADESDSPDSAPVNEVPVMLPPLVTSALKIDKNPWRYASVPGFEILTRASDGATLWYLSAVLRGKYIEDHLLPPEWLPEPAASYILIVDDTDPSALRRNQIHTKPLDFEPPADAVTWGVYSESIRLSTRRHAAGDCDTYAINVNLYDLEDAQTAAIGTVSFERLGRCSPPLPAWLTVGLLGGRGGVLRAPFAYPITSDKADPEDDFSFGSIFSHPIGAGMLWISIAETEKLERLIRSKKEFRKPLEIGDAKGDIPVKMLPLETFFAGRPASGEDLAIWESEASLFVRWGLFGPRHKQPGFAGAFVRFVERARREPITEAVFKESFGISYGAMQSELREFLVECLAQPVQLEFGIRHQDVYPVFQPATSDQIGRLLGSWLWMHARSVRQKDPELCVEELQAARRILERAYRDDNGLPPDVDPNVRAKSKSGVAGKTAKSPTEKTTVMERLVVSASQLHDSDLVAVFGLNEHELGDDVKAREFLERAVKLETTRLAAYRVLAQLRFNEAKSKPAGRDGKLSADQAERIMDVLRRGLQGTPSAEAFALLADIWESCEARPNARCAALIIDGAHRFPHNQLLTFRSARLCVAGGFRPEANDLVEQGLRFAKGDARDQFEALQKALNDQGKRNE